MRKLVACMVAVVAAGTSMASPGPTPLAANSTIPPPNDVPYPGTLKLSVDTTDITRRVFKVHEDIPIAVAGDVVLFYPRWLPGTHAPEGPIDRLAGLTVSARGARIAWTRDALDPFAFHVPVPAGVTAIGVDFTYLSPVGKQIGRQEVGREMLVLDWDAVVLYPAGYFTRQIPIEATIRVPDGWRVACALDIASSAGAATTFKAVPVETLVDSPLHAGRYYQRYDLAPGDKTPVVLDLTADRADLLDVSPKVLDLYRQLVQAGVPAVRLQALRPLQLPARAQRRDRLGHHARAPSLRRVRRTRRRSRRLGQDDRQSRRHRPRIRALVGRQVSPSRRSVDARLQHGDAQLAAVGLRRRHVVLR